MGDLVVEKENSDEIERLEHELILVSQQWATRMEQVALAVKKSKEQMEEEWIVEKLARKKVESMADGFSERATVAEAEVSRLQQEVIRLREHVQIETLKKEQAVAALEVPLGLSDLLTTT